ncbi:glycosyltransferase family 9 protein [Sphingobacterium sp. DN04309]|uniref:Glycosyltransferase family 9 protein n=2 Tax=Sphingobacterium litopenaei TaxID=2763500 RepID=A0ABR7YH43_9SPHI|nr:glycosyltransferase family 9 protein [Sphingobacterium litopenaei]
MKIGIFRALYLGDILCSIPAIRHLKCHYPDSCIYYIGLPHLRDFVMRFSFIDFYIDFPGCEGLPEQEVVESEVQRFIREGKEEEFDLLIQMHGNGTIVNDFLGQLEAKRLVGFSPETNLDPVDWFPYPESEHEVHRHFQLLKHIGIPAENFNEQLEYPIFVGECQDFEALKEVYGFSEYVVFHVGAKSELRRWPIQNFALLAKYLKKYNLKIVCTGTTAEYAHVKEFINLIGENCINLAGLTGYGSLGCIIRDAKLLVSNCTGVSHIAAALKTKSIIISLDGEPERWGPLNMDLHVTFNGLEPLSIESIFRRIDKFLQGS